MLIKSLRPCVRHVENCCIVINIIGRISAAYQLPFLVGCVIEKTLRGIYQGLCD